MKELEELKSSFNNIFEDISVADKIIKKHVKQNAVNKDKLDKNFMLFMRTEYLTTELLYFKHCQEIAWRIIKEEDTRPATNAELLNLTSSASSQVKFSADGTLVFDKLYTLVMKQKSPANGIFPQPYQGYTDKLIETIRKKYVISDRKLVL